MIELVKEVFNHVYLHVYGDEYTFSNKKVLKDLNAFVNNLPDGVGSDWLYRFILFQFAYYDGMKTSFGRVYINWIFGQKALKRWSERTDEQVYYANLYKQRIGLVIASNEPVNCSQFYEFERTRFSYDMNRQLLHCHDNALFDIKECVLCEMYKVCKLNG